MGSLLPRHHIILFLGLGEVILQELSETTCL
jgi:hypothetical protein